MGSVELGVALVQLIRQDTHTTFNTSFIFFRFYGLVFFPYIFFLFFSWPLEIGSQLVLVSLCTLKSQISQSQRQHATAKQFEEVLTSVNQEKVEDIFSALHLKKSWDLCLFQPSELPQISASASLLSLVCFLVKISSVQMQVHFVQQFILLTLAHVTKGKKQPTTLQAAFMLGKKKSRLGNYKIFTAPVRLLPLQPHLQT